MNVDTVYSACRNQITQAIQRRTHERGAAESLIDELPFHRNPVCRKGCLLFQARYR